MKWFTALNYTLKSVTIAANRSHDITVRQPVSSYTAIRNADRSYTVDVNVRFDRLLNYEEKT